MRKNILLGITGSIAAYKACELISLLTKKGHNVTCIMTNEAEEFVTPLTMETLSANKVYREMFKQSGKYESAHVSLAQSADLVVICPATANTIGKLASGLCDDLLTCTVISSTSPVLIAPAMNDNMYKHKITQRNLRELKRIGYEFVDPVRGRLTCGYVGMGHIAPLGSIVKKIDKILK
ncbi:MAG: flavoprotein [Candidatus Omnitrophota bacterium]